MNWVFEHFGTLVFIFVAISFVRAIMRAARLSAEHKATTDETEEQKRVREIQERIRRKVAERRGGAALDAPQPSALPVPRSMAQPLPRTSTVPPLDPFGGPMRRLLVELDRKVETQSPPPPPAVEEPTAAALMVRQEQLAKELRSLEETRVLVERRAAGIATIQKDFAESEAGGKKVVRDELLADLRGASNLRRAFLLREVLGAPIALR
jgi:hypothetical protein